MIYKNIVYGKFISRPNRFTANVRIGKETEVVHVKNTGRCRELLLPGANVVLQKADNPNRKTKYDLIMVWKDKLGWVNIDSQAPNIIAGEWLKTQGFELIRPEFRFGGSRIDFYMEKNGDKYLMEVKGCTLEVEGRGYFPDAPTARGTKHLRELIYAVKNGYRCALAFVIQMNGINEVIPNLKTDPEFGNTLSEARAAGVEIINLCCRVSEDKIEWDKAVSCY